MQVRDTSYLTHLQRHQNQAPEGALGDSHTKASTDASRFVPSEYYKCSSQILPAVIARFRLVPITYRSGFLAMFQIRRPWSKRLSLDARSYLNKLKACLPDIIICVRHRGPGLQSDTFNFPLSLFRRRVERAGFTKITIQFPSLFFITHGHSDLQLELRVRVHQSLVIDPNAFLRKKDRKSSKEIPNWCRKCNTSST